MGGGGAAQTALQRAFIISSRAPRRPFPLLAVGPLGLIDDERSETKHRRALARWGAAQYMLRRPGTRGATLSDQRRLTPQTGGS